MVPEQNICQTEANIPVVTNISDFYNQMNGKTIRINNPCTIQVVDDDTIFFTINHTVQNTIIYQIIP